jgi:hypothetical protein
LPSVLVFMLLTAVIMQMFGLPSTPSRGAAMLRLNDALTLAFSLINAILVFAVLDAIRLCKRFVQLLQGSPSHWPQPTIDLFATQFHLKEPQSQSQETQAGTLDDWIDIHFIARHTEAIGKLMWYPAIVMTLLVIARADVFDNWTMPMHLLAIYLMLCVFLGYLALSLQRAAGAARETALTSTGQKLIAAKGRKLKVLATQIELLTAAIRDIHHGAFLPISQRPLVKAAMMGVGSVGGVALLNYLNIVAR